MWKWPERAEGEQNPPREKKQRVGEKKIGSKKRALTVRWDRGKDKKQLRVARDGNQLYDLEKRNPLNTRPGVWKKRNKVVEKECQKHLARTHSSKNLV